MPEEWTRRLDGWKSIAAHLGRTSRTVQRWHVLHKLPVHHMGGRGGGAFAYTDEIDRWFRLYGRVIETEPSLVPQNFLIAVPLNGHGGDRTSSGDRQIQLEDGTPRRSLVEEGFQLWRLLSDNNLPSIARTFREAIDRDPLNAQAYAGLAHALIAQAAIGSLSARSAYHSARFAAEASLKLDPASVEARSALAWIKMVSERDWQGAQITFDELLAQGPASTRVMAGRALLNIAQGFLEAASELLYAAAESDPLSVLLLGLHTWSEYLAGRYSEVMEHLAQAHRSGRSGPIFASIEALTSVQVEVHTDATLHIENLLAHDPGNELVQGALGYVAGRSGHKAKAQAILESLARRRSHAKEDAHYAITLVHIGLEEKEKAMQSIVQSYEAGSLWSLGFRVDPALSLLAEEATFKSFATRAYPAPGKPTIE